jgi:hypothetical protein
VRLGVPSETDLSNGMLLIERNYFAGSNLDFVNIVDLSRIGQVGIRDNVFNHSGRGAVVLLNSTTRSGSCAIVNNTMIGETRSIRFENERFRDVRIENNDLGTIMFLSATPNTVAETWRVSHNAYAQPPSAPNALPAGSNDVVGFPKYESLIPSDRNFCRLSREDPRASGGVGGNLPNYIGALPPGPAPPEGDWFTRLRERWQEVREESPESRDKIPEPATQ